MYSINWNDVDLETVNESMKRRIVTGEKMTVARIYFKDGFLVRYFGLFLRFKNINNPDFLKFKANFI